MKRRLLCLAFALVAPMTLLAQTSGILSGRVVDDENKPLIGARIVLQGTKIGGLSKAPDGKFTIAGIRAGDYQVEIAGIGQKPVIRSAHISVGQTTDLGTIKLLSQAIEGVEVKVFADRIIERERTTTTREIGNATMERSSRTNIIDAVALQAGVDTRGQNGISLRGGRSSETSVRVDGVEITDPFSGGFGNTNAGLYPTVSPIAVQEVQVIPNPNSAEFGDAISGVVNSVTRAGRNDRYEGVFRYRAPVPALYGNADPITVKIAGSDRDTTLGPVKKMSSHSQLYEFGFGGPFPAFDDLTFYITGKVNTIENASASYEVYDMSPEFAASRASLADKLWGYHLDPTNLGQLDDNTAAVRDLNAKFKLTISPEISLELSGEYGLTTREFGGWGDLYRKDQPIAVVLDANGNLDTSATYARDPVTGRFVYTKPLNIVTNSEREGVLQSIDQNTIIKRINAKYFQSLDQATYFEVTGSYLDNYTEVGKKIEREYGLFEPYEFPAIEDVNGDKIIDNYFDPAVTAVLNPYLDPKREKSQIRLHNPLTGLYEGGEVNGASRNPFGLTDGNFTTHGNDRNLEIRQSQTMTFKGMFETNFDLDDVRTQIKAGFDVSTYTLRRHYNSLPWNALPFFDAYGFAEIPYYDDNKEDDQYIRSVLEDPFHPMDGALWVQTQFDYKTIVLTPGVRFDFTAPNGKVLPKDRAGNEEVATSLRTGGDASMKFQVSPRLGVSYPITDMSQFRVSFAMMFKMPDYNRMFDNAYGNALRGGQIFGNPDIDPQKVFNYEIGYSAAFGDTPERPSGMFSVDVVAFYRDIYNQVGLTFVPIIPTPYQLSSVQDYGNVRGLEVSLTKELADNFGAQLSYTLQRAVGTSSSPDENYNLRSSTDPYTGEPRSEPLLEYPLTYDRTHKLNTTLTFRWAADEGPSIGGINLLENTTLTITGVFASGLPYTRLDRRGAQAGEFRGERQPSTFSTEAHLEKGFRLADLLGESVGNLEISFFADFFNLLNTTPAIFVYTTSGSPTTNLTSFDASLGDFTASQYYSEINPSRPETYSQQQYDRFGNRFYNPYADMNLDGVVTQLEKYEGYRRFITTVQSASVRNGNFQEPRAVYVGARVKF